MVDQVDALIDDRRPLPANRFDDDFRRFFSQLLCHSRESRSEQPGGTWAGFLPVAHLSNRRLQFHNAIVSETFRRSFFLRARHSEPRDLANLASAGLIAVRRAPRGP